MKKLHKPPLRSMLPFAIAFGALLILIASFADASTPVASGTSTPPNDYFHTGAAAHYLVRAKTALDVEPQRGNITASRHCRGVSGS